jgi:2,4-dienoyl-CoA reductase-like NADH-dependent reductase (Old Yellow Enzyme family)
MVSTVRTFRSVRADWRTPAVEFFRHQRQFHECFQPKGRVPTETAREMSLEDIRVTIEDHVHAAKCAIEAGFDAVEIVRLSLPRLLRLSERYLLIIPGGRRQ